MTALALLREQQVIAEVLEAAEAMWIEFQDHFERAKDAPLELSAVADAIGKSVEFVDLVHIYMLQWWRTPRSITPAEADVQLAAVSEEVFDHESFDDCISELWEEQLRRL